MEKNNPNPHSVRLSPEWLSQPKRFGLKSLKHFGLTLALFVPINILAVIYAAFYFNHVPITYYLLSIGTLFLLGIGFIVLASYFTYQYLLKEAGRLIYKESTPFFRNLCTLTIEKICDHSINPLNLHTQKWDRIIDFSTIRASSDNACTPVYFQKGLRLIIRRIPLSNVAFDLLEVAQNKNQPQASALLYQRIDQYINASIFAKKNMSWRKWLWFINSMMIGLIIYINSLIS